MKILMMLYWKMLLRMILLWAPQLTMWSFWFFHLVFCHRNIGVSNEFLLPKSFIFSHWTEISVVLYSIKHLSNLHLIQGFVESTICGACLNISHHAQEYQLVTFLHKLAAFRMQLLVISQMKSKVHIQVVLSRTRVSQVPWA